MFPQYVHSLAVIKKKNQLLLSPVCNLKPLFSSICVSLHICLQRVEETVQKLEAELAVLLDTIQAREWSSLLISDTAGPAVDILDESNVPPHS